MRPCRRSAGQPVQPHLSARLARVCRPTCWQLHPSLAFVVGHAVRWIGQNVSCKTAARNADFFGQGAHEPKQRGAAVGAAVGALVPGLIMILGCVVEGVNLGFTDALRHRRLIEISRDAIRAPGSAFAIRAVANAVHRRRCVHRDGGLAAGAGGCHGWPLTGF